jgi:phage gp46-like protein
MPTTALQPSQRFKAAAEVQFEAHITQHPAWLELHVQAVRTALLLLAKLVCARLPS